MILANRIADGTANMLRLPPRTLALLLAAMMAALAFPLGAAAEGPSHGIAMHGEPELSADFTHFPYADPDAPQGGRLNYAVPGSFDSINPLIVDGCARPACIRPVLRIPCLPGR